MAIMCIATCTHVQASVVMVLLVLVRNVMTQMKTMVMAAPPVALMKV